MINQNDNYVNVNISGISDGYLAEKRIKILKGRSLTVRDNEEKKYTAIISDVFVNQYCKGEDVLGKPIVFSTNSGESIEINVVGIYETPIWENKEGISEQDRVTNVYLPYDVVNVLNSAENETFEYFGVLWNIDMGVESDEANITDYFEKIYKNNEEWTIYIQNDQSEVDMINNILFITTIAISVIAAISLFVGGIGVMNIMLVSIVERTKEIGIRKALGAQNSSIRLQFVIESIIICIIGGAIGIVTGLVTGIAFEYIGMYFINSNFAEYASIIQITIEPSITAILISLISSTIVGLVFGYYPANRAAKMNPIDALRYE